MYSYNPDASYTPPVSLRFEYNIILYTLAMVYIHTYILSSFVIEASTNDAVANNDDENEERTRTR